MLDCPDQPAYLSTMIQHSLFFTGPNQVETRLAELAPPGPGQLLVRTVLSGISHGTEMLVYRGQVPRDLALDNELASLPGQFTYPFNYGYATVGLVAALGAGVDPDWLDRLVFAFQPHCSAWLAKPESLFPLPPDISADDAVFFPNVETALNLVMDGAPLIGEDVAVFGLGIVGLLTTSLLAEFPLASIQVFDPLASRRALTADLAHVTARDPFDSGSMAALTGSFDLTFEISGQPAALNQAIGLTGFAGRVIIGSWYGSKPMALDLGGAFHHSRIRLVSSQVSTIAGELAGRWTRQRRYALVWDAIRRLRPSRWISHRFPLGQAHLAYQTIANQPAACFQTVLVPDA